MPKPANKRYAVLFRDHNGELDTQHLSAENIESAGGIFKEEYRYRQYSIIAIIETISGCNVYYPNGGEFKRIL